MIEIKSFIPQIVTSIEWVQVGNKLKAKDFGLLYDHIKSRVIVSGAKAEIITLFNTLQTSNGVYSFDYTGVPIFGPQYNYPSQLTLYVQEVIVPEFEYSDVCTIELNVKSNMLPLNVAQKVDLTSFYISDISRSTDTGLIPGEYMIGNFVNKNNTHISTAKLTINGTQEQVSKFLSYYYSYVRSDDISLSVGNGTFLFQEGTNTETCKIINITNIAPYDKGMTRWTLNVEVQKSEY